MTIKWRGRAWYLAHSIIAAHNEFIEEDKENNFGASEKVTKLLEELFEVLFDDFPSDPVVDMENERLIEESHGLVSGTGPSMSEWFGDDGMGENGYLNSCLDHSFVVGILRYILFDSSKTGINQNLGKTKNWIAITKRYSILIVSA